MSRTLTISLLDRMTTRWPDARRGPFAVTLHFAVVEGRLECVGLDVRSFEERRGSRSPIEGRLRPVNATVMRRLRPATLIRDGAATQAGLLRQVSRGGLVASGRAASTAKAMLGSLDAIAGGRRYDADHWRAVTDTYRDAHARGLPPTKAVADVFQVSRSTAAKWVARCRRFGLLGATEQRRAGERHRTRRREGR